MGVDMVTMRRGRVWWMRGCFVWVMEGRERAEKDRKSNEKKVNSEETTSWEFYME
jgi:hypothetical protein